MVDKVLVSHLVLNVLFITTGVVILVASLIGIQKDSADTDSVLALIIHECPLRAGVANGIMILATSALVIPSTLLRENRFWLKLQSVFIICCAIFTFVLSIVVWFFTLSTRARLGEVWANLDRDTQSMIQQEFSCCGYFSSTTPPNFFVQDDTCPNPLVAASKPGCVGPFSSFANEALDIIFTAGFGAVAVDMLLLISIAVVLKEIKVRERYRLIDAKIGNNGL